MEESQLSTTRSGEALANDAGGDVVVEAEASPSDPAHM